MENQENNSQNMIGRAEYLDPSSDQIIMDIYTSALDLYNVCLEADSLIKAHAGDKSIPLAEFMLVNNSMSQRIANAVALLKGIAQSFDATRRGF